MTIPTAAKNAAFLTLASRLPDSDLVYSEDFTRVLDEALEAAAPHMLADVERELRDAKRMVALLLLKAGGTVTVGRNEIIALSDDTELQMIERPIVGDWVISAKAPARG